MSRKTDNTIDSITARLILYDNDCLLWTGITVPAGYGQVSWRGKSVLVHRLLYEHFVGPIPDGLVLDHLCRTPGCANVEHLEAVTSAENIRRGRAGWPKGKPRGPQKQREACKRGHAFDEANTYFTRPGHRRCRTCQRKNQNRLYHAHRAPELAAPFTGACGRGHPFTSDNTMLGASGKRMCRLCIAARSQRLRDRKRP